MKKILVHLRDSAGTIVSESMSEEAAAREKERIEDEIANAGSANTIIRVGQKAALQSKDFLFLELIDDVTAGSAWDEQDVDPMFTRDMKF